MIDQSPVPRSATTHAEIRFHAVGGAARFDCQLDSGVAAACTSPAVFDVGDGDHQIEVVAFGSDGGAGAPATASFSVDTMAPDTVISAGPSTLSNSMAAAFTFASVPAGDAASFECSLDDAPFSPCTSPAMVSTDEGSHRFQVRAIDAVGNVDASPAMYSWTIDTIGPAFNVSVKPSDPSNVTTPTFEFSSTDPTAKFECQIDGVAPLASCTSPYVAPALADGQQTFRLRATDPAHNQTAFDYEWTVDTVPPVVTITDGPTGIISTTTPTFSFTVTGDAVAIACAIDDGAFAPCSSPFTTPALGQGDHAVSIRATDAATNAATVSQAFTVDTEGPAVSITGGPGNPTNDDTPTFTFNTSSDTVRTRCELDTSAVIDPCTSGVTFPTVAPGSHVFTVTAFDDAVPPNSASDSYPFVLGFCGDNAVQGSELCDGTDLGGATCEGLGHAPGTLGCNSTCDGYITTGCDGGFVAANDGFSGRVCFGGIQYSRAPSVYLAVCTEDAGAWKAPLGSADAPLPISWGNIDGTMGNQPISNLNGRAIVASIDNPAVVFLTDNSTMINGFRSNNVETNQAPSATTWAQQVAFSADGMPIELFSARTGPNTNNLVGGWHPTRGAVVAHGNFAATATVSTVGAAGTGTVSSIAIGVFSGVTSDVNIAVWGKTPAGDPAAGGIYWSCDISGTVGGSFVEHDAGIADSDKPLVWSLTADQASFSATSRTCPATGGTVSGFAAIYYAALRGGGQVYKTIDGGQSWAQSNTGLPAGAEVYQIAIDCSRFVSGSPNLCNNHNLLYAATSLGLYTSSDAGAHWTLAGLEGAAVRGVTLPPDHPVGTAPRIFVGVDDAVGIYQRNVP